MRNKKLEAQRQAAGVRSLPRKKEKSRDKPRDEEDEENNDFTLTVEFVESRLDKLKGRNQFKGTVVDQILPG